jgi:PqqD family protein of HPr-rel-A system
VTVPLVKPKARADLAVEELDGEAVIFDEESGDLHHLNPTATVVFGLCDGSATMRDLSADLSGVFGVPLEEIEAQVRTLVRQFRKANLLEPGRSEPSASDRMETTQGAS